MSAAQVTLAAVAPNRRMLGYESKPRNHGTAAKGSLMADQRDYYEVLGVGTSASGKEIAAAYRKLAIKFHPDSNPDDENAAGRFKEAAEAYEVLSDSDKRARYDQFGHAGVNGGASQFSSAEDIFQAFGDMFSGSIFDGLFGGGGGRRRRQRRGGDIRADVTLSLEEAATGVTKEITFSRSKACESCDGAGHKPGSEPQACRRCGGRGQVLVQSAGILQVQTTCQTCGGSGSVITDPCRNCSGAGYVADRVTHEVHIPLGVDDGTPVRLRGEGEPSPDGGPPGDCYCVVHLQPHDVFERDGTHLILRLPVTYSQAALGAKVEIPTLYGPDSLIIPPGTATAEVFRIRGRGMPDPRSGQLGQLLIQVNIEVPTKLTDRQQELLRELAELEQTHVTPQRKTFLDKIRDYFTKEEGE